MQIWSNSRTSTLYYSGDAADVNDPCVVKITPDEILVEYKQDGTIVQYKGKNSGDGHFALSSSSVNGRATLHMSPDSEILEGSWEEDGDRGMWRIYLSL